jgi:hypothetical protein
MKEKSYIDLSSDESLNFTIWCIDKKIPHSNNMNYTTYDILFEKHRNDFYKETL